MALKRDAKQAHIAKFKQIAEVSQDVLVADFQQLNALEMTKLRVLAREYGVVLIVMRNTLGRLALEDGLFACLGTCLVGPSLFAFSKENAGSAARLMRDFSKDHAKLVVKHLVFEGQLLEGKALNEIANLPTRSEAISQFMSVLRAPVQTLLRTIQEPSAKLLRTLVAIKDKKAQSETL